LLVGVFGELVEGFDINRSSSLCWKLIGGGGSTISASGGGANTHWTRTGGATQPDSPRHRTITQGFQFGFIVGDHLLRDERLGRFQGLLAAVTFGPFPACLFDQKSRLNGW
jgi:hypothetical protein